MSYLSTQYATLVASLLAFLMIASSGPLKAVQGRSVNLPSPQCHPSIINSMPPKIRKICDALSTIWEFSEAMESYLDEKASDEDQALMETLLDEAKSFAERRSMLQNTSVKRKGAEDVDHVFLRFGKRG